MNGPGVFAFWENVCGFGAADELAVLRFGTLEDGLTPADDVPYGLAAYVFTAYMPVLGQQRGIDATVVGALLAVRAGASMASSSTPTWRNRAR